MKQQEVLGSWCFVLGSSTLKKRGPIEPVAAFAFLTVNGLLDLGEDFNVVAPPIGSHLDIRAQCLGTLVNGRTLETAKTEL